MGAVMALIASMGWGVSDFLGGISSRAKSVLAVLAVSQTAGLVLVLAVYGLHGTMPLTQRAAPWAVGAGVASAATLGLLYLALAQGDVVVVAPLASAQIIVPVVAGLAMGIRVSPGIWAGLGLSVTGMIAVSWSSAGDGGDTPTPGGEASRPGRSRKLRAAMLALSSSGCAGLFLVLLSHASMGDPLAAASVVHVTSFAVAVVALGAGAARRGRRPRSGAATSLIARGWLAVAACGIGDGTADICYAWASMGNLVAVAAVVTSLYPVVTMVLAVVFLRERPGLVQGGGAVAVLAGVFLLTVAGAPMTHMMAHMPPVATGP